MSLKCQNCGAENVDHAKYCCECGKEMGFYCRKCGSYNPNGKYCISCGTKNDPVNWDEASTNPDDYSLENVYKDESGTYTADRLVFLRGNYDTKKIEIRQGTRIICDHALWEHPLYGDDFWIKAIVEELIIPNSVTRIGQFAFDRCSSLKSIVIPDSVTQIGDRAFYVCSSLKSIVIPESVTQIGQYAFSECSSLQSIEVSKGNAIYDSRNNCNAIIETENNTLVAGCSQTVIPDSVTQIGDSAFSGCSSLQSIVIPESVTEIGSDAFSCCRSLQSIAIPDSVTKMGKHAFSYCSRLQSIVIPDSVSQIGEYAFWDCRNLHSIVIPKGSKEKFQELLPDYRRLLKEE